MLPVSDTEGDTTLARYRERVYAYELYHQLRSIWPPEWSYSLAGEVDKAGHPIFRGEYLDRAKPDLLVHVPGEMESNLMVLEIKASSTRARSKLERDLRKLIEFCNVGYEAAAFLVFGDSFAQIQEVAKRDPTIHENLTNIQLWHHPSPNSPAAPVQW